QERTQAITTETIRIDTRTGGQAQIESMLKFRQSVGQQGFGPKQMRIRVQSPVAIKPVAARFAAELAFVPNRQFHREGGEKRRLAAAPTQAGANHEVAMIRRQLEIAGGVVVPDKGGIVGDAAHDAVKRDLLAWVEQVIETEGCFTAMSNERFVWKEGALTNLGIAVGEAATGDADAQVRVGAQEVSKAEF